jgi:hypothetical protein
MHDQFVRAAVDERHVLVVDEEPTTEVAAAINAAAWPARSRSTSGQRERGSRSVSGGGEIRLSDLCARRVRKGWTSRRRAGTMRAGVVTR